MPNDVIGIFGYRFMGNHCRGYCLFSPPPVNVGLGIAAAGGGVVSVGLGFASAICHVG